jgi:DNA-binding NarL/FixJ family response regulator
MTEAIFDSQGRLAHAIQPATTTASKLASAILAVQRARGTLRRDSPDEALEVWRALVDGRWSLVDQVDTDGKRFLLARKNDVTADAPAGVTSAERTVLLARARGLSIKLIAYETGFSISRVSAALRSGMGKLGLQSDADLVSLLVSSDDCDRSSGRPYRSDERQSARKMTMDPETM